jgi:hypothetical protein
MTVSYSFRVVQTPPTTAQLTTTSIGKIGPISWNRYADSGRYKAFPFPTNKYDRYMGGFAANGMLFNAVAGINVPSRDVFTYRQQTSGSHYPVINRKGPISGRTKR